MRIYCRKTFLGAPLMKVLVRLFPLLSFIISSCSLPNTSTKFEGSYQGTISSQETISPYTLDIVIDESGNYLGTLNNLDIVNSEITMRCSYGEEFAVGECIAINIFQATSI